MTTASTEGPRGPSNAARGAKSAYVHLPFCRHRCGYCNFTLEAGRDHLIDRFLDALERELSLRLDALDLPQPHRLDTLFFGGGTPSHLRPPHLQRLRQIVARHFSWDAGAEVTAECNPNDLSESRLEALVALGVNRFSLGVQSLRPDKLRTLERDHSPQEVAEAVRRIREYDAQISLDMIFASPDESLAQWREDLNSALSLEPHHLSTYELTFEKGTRFWNRLQRGELQAGGEDLRAQMYQETLAMVSAAGLEHYEVSSFARPGYRCRHNQVYWQGAPYWAFGPGAAGFIDGQRTVNHRSTLRYMQLLEQGSDPIAEREQLSGQEAARERLVIGLRLREGIDLPTLEQTTGMTLEEILGPAGAGLLEHGLLERVGSSLRLSESGLLLADGVASKILSQ